MNGMQILAKELSRYAELEVYAADGVIVTAYLETEDKTKITGVGINSREAVANLEENIVRWSTNRNQIFFRK